MSLRISFIIIIIFLSNLINLQSESKGSKVEIFMKNSEILKGELISVDSNEIELLVRLPKTPTSSKKTENLILQTIQCDSVNISGSFDGSTPYVISGILGIGTGAILLSGNDEPNYYIAGAISSIIGFFSYLFIDNTLTIEEIRFTEIDKYPWKLKPYSKEYKSN